MSALHSPAPLPRASLAIAELVRMLVRALVRRLSPSIHPMRWYCLNEPAVLHALEPHQPVGELLDLS